MAGTPSKRPSPQTDPAHSPSLGKRVGFSLSEIGEMLDLYHSNDGGAAQMAVSLTKFRERIQALTAQREDIDGAIGLLEDGCVRLQRRLSEVRPDLLPRAADYESVLRARLDEFEPAAAD